MICLQRDRLPHAAAPQDADGFSRHDIKADIVKHVVVAKRFEDVLKINVGSGLWVCAHWPLRAPFGR